MVKRPMIWIIWAFLIGIFLAWKEKPLIITIVCMVIFWLTIYLLMYWIKNHMINRYDRFLWFLPFFIILGFITMKQQLKMPELERVFDQKIRCEISGEIDRIIRKQWGSALYLKNNVVTLADNKEYLSENIIVFCYDNQNSYKKQDASLTRKYSIGNKIMVSGTLKKFTPASNPGQFNEKLYYQIEDIDYKMIADKIIVRDNSYSRYYAFVEQIKNRLLKVYGFLLSDKEAGTLTAMLLGEKYLLDEEIRQLYQINGISHILAISGLHVSLIGLTVYRLLKKMKIPIVISTFLSIFFIYSYGIMTDFSVSTNRAVVMMVLLLLSTLFGKTYDMLSGLALAAFVILLQNPLQIFSTGFRLSFAAVLGIAVIYPRLKKLFPANNQIMNSLLISISAQAATTPFVLIYFYQFPTYSILINFIILPFVTVLALTSIVAGIIGLIYLPLGIFCIGGANYILILYEWICRIGSKLPFHLITVGKPDDIRLLFYLLGFILFLWLAEKYNKWYTIFLPIVVTLLLLFPVQQSNLKITFLDVGQGDAIYMESRSGTTYLVDGGSSDVKRVGISRLQPFLLSQGKASIDYTFMTHSDMDHISGLKELMNSGKIKIRNLILPDIGNKDDTYKEIEALAKVNKIKLHYIKTGDIIKDGKLTIFCLHPAPEFVGENTNSYSTVLSVKYGDFDLLLTGDLEGKEEIKVIKELKNKELWEKQAQKDSDVLYPELRYDILKIAHHGSKYSTGREFLTQIRPEYSIISCGKNNRYGHPHMELVGRLEAVNSNTKTTYQSGAILVETDGKVMKVKGYLE